MKRLNRFSRLSLILLVTTCAYLGAVSAMAQSPVAPISDDEITALNTKLTEIGESSSAARKKLAIKRLVRELDALLKKHPTAANRFEILDTLFRSQQLLVSIDNSAENRKDFLETCEKLAAAPNEYAALRLDADLILTQAKSAKQGADSHARSDALRPLVARYKDTEVEAKVIRIAMIMALEFGNNKLVNDLREVIAKRLPGDMDLINFQREKLAGQVFGVPFIGSFPTGDGKTVKFPMDYLGTTTMLYCWSKENEGMEDLKALATDWKKAKVEHGAPGRFQIVSMNMDDLPDAGESILRELGLDWQAIKMPGGKDNPIYQTYIKRDTPTILLITPTGYAAIYQSGGRSDRSYERRLQSMMASAWAKPDYSSQLQSIFSGEFFILPTQGDFDPSSPPEYQAMATGDLSKQTKLARTEKSVPEETLRAIQACFINAPLRYRTPHQELVANYEKADSLCRTAITEHPEAPDLWIIRNRRIIALMSLWKARGDQQAFYSAVEESQNFINNSHPPGTDVIAQFCIAKQAFRSTDADHRTIINNFIKTSDGQKSSAPVLMAASLLALDNADRLLHDQFRRTFLDKHANDPTMWTPTAFLLDRYHRYWMYAPPFTAGWTYGRRQGYFLAIGTPEEAQRTFQTELKTLTGETVKIPESSNGKWTVISFVPSAAGDGYLQRYTTFLADRPNDDVNLIAAVLDDDVEMARKLITEKEEEQKKRRRQPDSFPTLLVPNGLDNPLLRQLGILNEQDKPNILILRPDGSIAVVLSGLTMASQKGSVIQNVIELHDEKKVDEALANGDIEEAKRLAFTHAPIKQVPPADAPKHWKPKKFGVTHLRSRAKVYLAMGNLEAALADAEQAYLVVNSKAGHISMRTDDLEETEALRDSISEAIKKQK